ncbi:MAG: ester cyclase [Bacteroidia bacterium]
MTISKSAKLQNAINLYEEAILKGDTDAVDKYVGDVYKQHSHPVKDGVEGFKEFFADFLKRNPKRDIKIVRAIEEGQYLFLHAHQILGDGETQWVTMDFFDTDHNGKIIEHWDVIAEYCGQTASGRTSVDGETEVTDLDKTDSNKELVLNLIKNVMMQGGEPSKIGEYISAEKYIQHNKDVPDGLAHFKELALASDRPLYYQEVVLCVAQGNFVATLCKATWNGKPYAQTDLFRVENGLVVEHWDAAEAILPKEQWVNSGKF